MPSVIGLSVFFYKWQVLGFPLTEDQEKPVWTIESAISFDSGPGSIKVQLHVPTLTPGFRMLNENSVSRGYGFSLNYGSGGREANDGYRYRFALWVRVPIRVRLVATKYQHVAFVEQVMLTTRDELDLAALAGQIFARAGRVRHSNHAPTGRQLGPGYFQAG